MRARARARARETLLEQLSEASLKARFVEISVDRSLKVLSEKQSMK